MSKVHGALTIVHSHETGMAALAAAVLRQRNTTIVIGADQDKGSLLLDIDVQGEVCESVEELREQLRLVLDALKGAEIDWRADG